MLAPTEEYKNKVITGLSEDEATSRLRNEGYNELPKPKKRTFLVLTTEVVSEPMFLLLIVGGIIYMILGDLQEALMLLGFVFLIIGITVYQERKTERTLEALKELSSPKALVIREEQQKHIPGREVVRGDLVLLSEGERIPADGVVVSSLNLSTDESLLTGESLPVRKSVWESEEPLVMDRPGGSDSPFVYSGTLVVQGQALARVLATGPRTEMGRIGKALQKVETAKTPLQKQTRKLVRLFAVIGICLCILVVVVYGINRGNWLEGFLVGITLAMAIMPNEFPVVLTIFLALGAWRISQQRVLTRRVPAVETLGAATVLCVDKTGTLTMNRMSVKQLFANKQFYEVAAARDAENLPAQFHRLLEYGVLACPPDPFDPMEKAIRELGKCREEEFGYRHGQLELVNEYPLSRKLLAMSLAWKVPASGGYVIAAKGAPEAVAELCRFSPAQSEELLGQVARLAARDLRILAVAEAHYMEDSLPADQRAFNFEFLGLLGLADPVRPTVPASLQECYRAGIRVIMITGDYPGTAQSIARQIGLVPNNEVITGPELDRMEDAELEKRIRTVNIFARVVPEQKLRLVMALKANGEIVAMTGDGVNDAPALKAAHIGIAMGERGTDVAREAAALVLLDDDFSSIVRAIKMGRRIFDNLKKGMVYILAIHVPIAGMSILPVIFGWPLMLLPVHIAFLHLIIDPACSVVFEAEAEEAGVMQRPPRSPREPLFSRRTLGISLGQGISVLVLLALIFPMALYLGEGEGEARALAFTTLIVANLALIFTNRSWSQTVFKTFRLPNTALWWVVGGALVVLPLVLYLPLLRELFRFSTLNLLDLALCLVAGLVSTGWFEFLKYIRNRPAVTPRRAAGRTIETVLCEVPKLPEKERS
ncbi:MAG TPA: cation-translocating P-type ATPase [Chloroflexia bacterium]|nr:cation-translocating P-type ATPase [Chloroflexia bacterium]